MYWPRRRMAPNALCYAIALINVMAVLGLGGPGLPPVFLVSRCDVLVNLKKVLSYDTIFVNSTGKWVTYTWGLVTTIIDHGDGFMYNTTRTFTGDDCTKARITQDTSLDSKLFLGFSVRELNATITGMQNPQYRNMSNGNVLVCESDCRSNFVEYNTRSSSDPLMWRIVAVSFGMSNGDVLGIYFASMTYYPQQPAYSRSVSYCPISTFPSRAIKFNVIAIGSWGNNGSDEQKLSTFQFGQFITSTASVRVPPIPTYVFTTGNNFIAPTNGTLTDDDFDAAFTQISSFGTVGSVEWHPSFGPLDTNAYREFQLIKGLTNNTQWKFTNRYYATSIGEVQIFTLDTPSLLEGTDSFQEAWLGRALQSGSLYKVMIGYHCIPVKGPARIQELLLTLMGKYNVTTFMCGSLRSLQHIQLGLINVFVSSAFASSSPPLGGGVATAYSPPLPTLGFAVHSFALADGALMTSFVDAFGALLYRTDTKLYAARAEEPRRARLTVWDSVATDNAPPLDHKVFLGVGLGVTVVVTSLCVTVWWCCEHLAVPQAPGSQEQFTNQVNNAVKKQLESNPSPSHTPLDQLLSHFKLATKKSMRREKGFPIFMEPS